METARIPALETLSNLSKNIYNQSIKEWKAQNKPVVGYLCSYIPEEIFYAADVLPVRIGARGCQSTAHADSLMASITCSYCRSCLELALTDEYAFLDGLVYMNGCENMRRMADNWRHKVPLKFCHVLSVPQRPDKEGIAWYKDELTDLGNQLNRSFGSDITKDRLVAAINLCNESRSLLKNLYKLREHKHPPLSGSLAHEIVILSGAMPKDKYNKLLADAIKELGGKKGITDYRARIMVVGNMLDEITYTEIIEEAGAIVVTDIACFGSLSFWEPVKLTPDPLDGLAAAYLDGVPCPRQPFKNAALAQLMGKMARDFTVDGIIFERMVHCSLWSCETLSLEKDAEDMKLPLLVLEREYMPSGIGQLKTRIQAFIEMIEGGKR